ncbi:MAG: DNA polymerase/3'-5' exonuclease PolX [Euryarchaeota archaeon]|nr:DNA polymerase/3'-5' exonuclease PolX [Euryarchaeota archaeon]MBT6775885.1 DNA polymerase/3'-5' exonuclease PolX [Euryarchaeota archaeon]
MFMLGNANPDINGMVQDLWLVHASMAKVSGWTLPKSRRQQAPYVSKTQLVDVLEQIAILLELSGANGFRVRAYQNGSRALASMEEDLFTVVSENRVVEIKGIGKGIGGLITEAVMQGTWGDMQSLYDKIPPGLIEIVGIPGLGPKRARILHESLGVDSVEALKTACELGHVSPLSGFGEKSQKKYLEGIDLLRRYQGRTRMDVGLLYGRALQEKISEITGVEKAQLAGSARRRRETIGDLDIVVSSLPENHKNVISKILNLPGIAEVKGYGESKVSLILEQEMLSNSINSGSLDERLAETLIERNSDATIDAQVRIVNPEMFPFTLAYFTGSKEHNIRMRQEAINRGLRLNEFGLFPESLADGKIGMEAAKYTLNCSDESEIYKNLGMNWIPPEMREDMGEIEASSLSKSSLPKLIMPSDLRGAFHNHTVYSDGTNTLEEMAQAAQSLGWEYLGIADHSETLNIGGRQIGIPSETVPKQSDEIIRLNKNWKDQDVNFRLFHGSECDILADGKLDYSNEVRNLFSHVVGSVHALGSWRNRDEIDNTEALIRAVEDPTFTILGHPTGRILQVREGFPIDMHAVIRRMGELNSDGHLKAIEINASPYRLDLDWRLCKFAKEQKVPICINPDAHDTSGLDDVWYGVQIARKGWLESSDILNTKSSLEIESLFND